MYLPPEFSIRELGIYVKRILQSLDEDRPNKPG